MNKHLRNAFGILLVVSLLAPLAASAAASPGVVNVNTATIQQLQLLPRVGPSVAQRILDYRKENGKFSSLDDLMLVRGIGEATFAQLKPYVSLSGETTLAAKVKSARGTSKPAQTASSKPAPAAAEAASGASRLTTSRMPKALRRVLFTIRSPWFGLLCDALAMRSIHRLCVSLSVGLPSRSLLASSHLLVSRGFGEPLVQGVCHAAACGSSDCYTITWPSSPAFAVAAPCPAFLPRRGGDRAAAARGAPMSSVLAARQIPGHRLATPPRTGEDCAP